MYLLCVFILTDNHFFPDEMSEISAMICDVGKEAAFADNNRVSASAMRKMMKIPGRMWAIVS